MKVERPSRPPAFRPIVLTLESRDELDALFHMVNCSTSVNLSEYYGNSKKDEDDFRAHQVIKERLYKVLYDFFYSK